MNRGRRARATMCGGPSDEMRSLPALDCGAFAPYRSAEAKCAKLAREQAAVAANAC